jgi:thiamine-phosphate pyrophosphorylase
MTFQLPAVYPITDKELAGRSTHLSIVRELVRGGARLIQIRDKSTPLRLLIPDLCRCVEHCEAKGVLAIVNDRCDLALISDAQGVHLGQDDLPPERARALLGRKRIVGFSTHSLPQVRKASRLPVDYIAVGPIFPTATKADAAEALGLELLRRACRISGRPVVAIGGIGPRHVRQALDSGAQSVAVISSLMRAPNIAREMERLLNEARGKERSGKKTDTLPARDPSRR